MRIRSWMGSAVGTLCFVGLALADDTRKKTPSKEEAQATVDAAKVDVCEKGKKFLADQKTKGKCAAEADEAAKVTCSVATSKQVTDLMTKCTSAKPATEKVAEKAVAPATPKCHAVETTDATKTIAEAEDKASTKCTRLLMDKVKEAKCTDAANKGKKIAYTAQFDHTIGTGTAAKKLKDAKQSVTCPKK